LVATHLSPYLTRPRESKTLQAPVSMDFTALQTMALFVLRTLEVAPWLGMVEATIALGLGECAFETLKP